MTSLPTTTRDSTRRRQGTTTALIAGVGLGTFAALAEHSIFTTSLGQMITPWILVAAAVGYASHRAGPAAAGGAGALLIANLTYHFLGLGRGYANSVGPLMRWTVLGLIAGSLFGIVGRTLRSPDPLHRMAAVTALAALAMAESIALWSHIDHPEAHATYIVVGLVATVGALVGGHRLGSTVRTVVATAVAALPMAVVLEIVLDRLGVV